MAVEISMIKNAELQSLAKSVDKNNDGKLKRNEYFLFAKEAQAQGIDYKEIDKALDMNSFQKWWYDVDKISTDGNDDGKLSFKEGAMSFVKGMIGGIPKAIITNPLISSLSIGLGALITKQTKGAILPTLSLIGILTGVVMLSFGTYKTITSKTDGDAKRALETMGMGLTTASISSLTVKDSLQKAEMAGVKSALVAEGTNIWTKILQAIKSFPESVKMSTKLALSRIKKTPTIIKYADGSKMTVLCGKIVDETLPDGTFKQYNKKGNLVEERFPNGTIHKYSDNSGAAILDNSASLLIGNGAGSIAEGAAFRGSNSYIFRGGSLMKGSIANKAGSLYRKGFSCKKALGEFLLNAFDNDGDAIRHGYEMIIYHDKSSKIGDSPSLKKNPPIVSMGSYSNFNLYPSRSLYTDYCYHKDLGMAYDILGYDYTRFGD